MDAGELVALFNETIPEFHHKETGKFLTGGCRHGCGIGNEIKDIFSDS